MATKIGRILMLPKGKFSETETYSFLDIVEKDGSCYLCKKDSKGIDVSDTNYWMMIASCGKPFTYNDLTEEQKAELSKDATEAAERAAQSVEAVSDFLQNSSIQTTETQIICMEESDLEIMSPSLFLEGVFYFGLEELTNDGGSTSELEGTTLSIVGAQLSGGVLELSGNLEGTTLTL